MSEGVTNDRAEHQDPEAAPAWHAQDPDAVLGTLDSGDEGLSAEEATRRLETRGPNEIREGEQVSPLAIFVSQFQDVLIYLLVVAAVLSVAVGFLPGAEPQYVDAGLILAILLANGIFGFVQDYRAEQSMAALRDLSSPDATVIREGEKHVIDSTEVVPGDVVVIEQGDAIPADARLLAVTELQTNESALTGESGSVRKDVDAVDADTPLAEQRGMVFMNTSAVRGRGRAVVVDTGMDTEVGSIATQIQAAEDEQTPFQAEVDDLGKRIGYGIGAVILVIAVVQALFTSADLTAILLTAVTLAVAAVPEGLPAVVTLTLAMGSRKMVRKNALVRRLPVVESLGAVDTILTDKTGTLTANQMTVRRILAGDAVYEVTGSGLATEGEFEADDGEDRPGLEAVLRCGFLCNNAEPAPDTEDTDYFGDPTEVALLVAARKAGIDPDAERLREIPFSSDRKRMTVVVDEDGSETAYVKGAPETILERCDRIRLADGVVELTEDRREAILARTEAFASDALRVLGFARRRDVDPDADAAALEDGLEFLGLQGMIDPPRPEVEAAVADCRGAGIRVVMVTGDNLETAKAIGAEIGFDPEGALTGPEVEAMSDGELQAAVEEVEVFARVSPAHKVRVLEALQANDHRVAMTGDGVNDAPGVRNADVGIAMGIRGTDVTQEAADMVLQDDNFATIRDAIAAGRGIFDNIRKFVNLLLSANTSEVLAVFAGVLLGSALFPDLFASQSEALVLTPVMLLWINLVTDGLPALALGVDPTAPDVLDREPREPDASVIDRRVVASILSIGVTLTVVGLALFFWTIAETASLVGAQTVLFTFLVVAEMGVIQVIRRRFGQGLTSNPWLIAAVLGSLALQGLVLYSPLADLFDLAWLGGEAWTAILAGVAVALVVTGALSLVADRALGRD